jgi:hypothetical protein
LLIFTLTRAVIRFSKLPPFGLALARIGATE